MRLKYFVALITSQLCVLAQQYPGVSEQIQRGVLESAARLVETGYVLAGTAPAIADSIRALEPSAAYVSTGGAVGFAKAVNQRIRTISSDPHLALHYSPLVVPDEGTADLSLANSAKAAIRRTNFGFSRTELLSGNIGYLKIDAFYPPELSAQSAEGALALLSAADGLIIDLRDNQGGDPAMVSYLCSFFLGPRPVHLNTLETRAPSSVRQYWTVPVPPNLRSPDRPVSVLTSKRTISAGEEFIYGLRAQNRIKVFGERTAGGAHLTKGLKVGEHFILTLPIARSINPVTHTNWEGQGIQPDFYVSSSDALTAAHLDLLQLARNEKDPDWKKALEIASTRVRALATSPAR